MAEPQISIILNGILDAAGEALVEYGFQIKKYMFQNAPLGFGTLRQSFQVTGLTENAEKLKVSVVSNEPYAREMDEEARFHMPFETNSKSGQRSFEELGTRGGGREARYWSGFAEARERGLAQRYKSNYTGRSIEDAGGEKELANLVDIAIERKLGAI